MKKECPLAFCSNIMAFMECREERCAWWDEERQACTMAKILKEKAQPSYDDWRSKAPEL